MKLKDVLFTAPENFEQLSEIREVMREAWGMQDYGETLPVHVMKAIMDNGGFLEVAILNGRVIGFAVGFIGYSLDYGYYLYSHMLGVRREYRGKDVALMIKLSQRDWSIRRGYRLVVWTYDPHQGLNARFNFGKLGVISRQFHENYYGEIRDELNTGLPTDRFKVEWWVLSKRVEDRLNGRDKPPSFDDIKDEATLALESKAERGCRIPIRHSLENSNELVLVEFPGDINVLRASCPESALTWKLMFRDVIKDLLAKGYIIVEHIPLIEEERRNFYLVVKSNIDDLLEGEYPWK
ncbi:MAG: GNAT family N-acetyltransferase [Infirmifilum sp.]|uniref:GNAT family N-acetyltransferase n=1 Tax=Infirmifilum uzonense TaxID=1550241 RepID=UPI00069B7AFC|nr:GNAT family N-acetyltransferase [Infirmifilum uzonense]